MEYLTPETAKELCIKAHAGQYRKPFRAPERSQVPGAVTEWDYAEHEMYEYIVKLPYSSHPIAVAEMLSTDEEKILGYLHDVIEDCEDYNIYNNSGNPGEAIITYEPEKGEYKRYGITEDVYNGLRILTHDKSIPYDVYIQEIAKTYAYYHNLNPLKVKLADMFHNMSSNPSEKQKKKYLNAIPMLLEAL